VQHISLFSQWLESSAIFLSFHNML